LDNKLKNIKQNLTISYYEKYINDCKNKKNFNRKKISNEIPFLSVCICTYNSEKYVEKAILSILNQSFQDFEIIIIDDFSTDNSSNIFKKYQKNDERIKIINHTKNLGIYRSRVDAIYYSKGEYILFVDADDMLLNQYLFEILFSYSIIYHFDIIEYLVLYQGEGRNNLVYPPNQILTHIHNYSDSVIFQPELSMIIFYIPRTNNFTSAICRTLWNKLYKKDILLKSIKYIGEKFYLNSYLNYAEDTIMNILNFHFAKNYTNINIHGYMYNVRNNSISRFTNETKKRYILNSGIYYYLKLLYKYIKEFNMDRQLLYLELELFNKQINFLKENDPHFFKKKMKKLFDAITEDNNASNNFKSYIKNLTKY
jgi:glycosyltransferase involved in cell wall biosynthesis